jgi:iron complex outermembrane receptor protein
MTNRKRAFWATTALFSGLLLAGAASAQSSGTTAAEATNLGEVVVTGARGPFTTDGSIVAETVAKTRSSITQEFISTQNPGQTILQTLNLTPGLNFVNADPYGNSGGNIRLRGFDGNRVSLTFDGIPLNDTGNYAAYTNQQLDPELIERASVNTGTTDVDSPTASATGGTINYVTARPLEEMGGQIGIAAGSFNYHRFFGRLDTGAFGPFGTTAYATASVTDYDKFKGPGNLTKQQYNARIYQDLGNGNFASLAGHWNVNRNDFYNNFINQAQFNSGNYLEQDRSCRLPTGGPGAQNDNTQATIVRSDDSVLINQSCTNYYGLRINPSNTGNIRGQFSYGLTDSLRFTFDPSYQYTLANGGNYSFVSERDNRLDQDGTSTTGVGVDLNGDGDTLDTLGVYAPSNTNTNRYGIISSLIWDINEDHRIRVAYTLDYGRHRQTGEGILLGRDGRPANVFGGYKDGAPELRLVGRDGSFYRSRDRASIAELNQFALEYRGQFLDDSVTINIGARAPFFRRELNQYCYTLNGTSTVRCTTEAELPDNTATPRPGNVSFAGLTNQSWIKPYQAELKFDDILPSAGIVWRYAQGQSVYASYAEGISVPRTDNLYQPVRSTTGDLDFSAVQPETTKSFDLGWRFRNDMFLAQAALWYTDYQNRIVSARDNDPNSPTFDLTIDRNVGAVKQWGFDGQVGWNVTDFLTLYASASYNNSEVQEDLFLGTFSCTNLTQVPTVTPFCPTAPAAPLIFQQYLPLAGKSLVETPDWTFSVRGDWEVTSELSIGLQAKYVGDRFATDVNDEVAPSYIVADFDARYDLTRWSGVRNAFIQLNVTNLFDEGYLGNISSGNNALPVVVNPDPRVPLRAGVVRTYSIGAPQTAVISLGLKF